MSNCARSLRALSIAELDRYETDGFIFPVQVLDADQVADWSQRFLDYVAAYPEHYETLFWGGRLMYVDTHLFDARQRAKGNHDLNETKRPLSRTTRKSNDHELITSET